MNKIIQGDAIENMRLLEDKSIDLLITDPPYQFISNSSHGGGFMTKENKKHFDNIKQSFGLKYDPEKLLNEAKRVLKKMNMYIFTNKNLLLEYLKFARDNKYSFDILLWLKSNPVPVNNHHYLTDKEYIFFMRESGSVFNSKLGYENYFTYFSHPIGRKGKVTKHPTEKPINPIRKMIQISSNENDIVLDPYVGSGTVCVAAKELGRRYIGIENNEEYIKMAEERLK